MADTTVSRASAREAGSKRFFTGQPCLHGHLVERFVSSGNCVACAAIGYKKWYAENSEYVIQKQAAIRIENPQKIRDIRARSRVRHVEKARARTKIWQKNNPDRMRFYANKRRCAEIQATPYWCDQEAIKIIYAEAVRLENETGVLQHVDHIIPLHGKTVCGLHVPWNLQVIPAEENQRKYNLLDGE
jgi:hypothetical protein